jgi:CubicO group peptidase (beta-lactamase class C family)
MIRSAIAATALLIAAVPAIAQNQQEALDARYDRALAAGYKALTLCSAIGDAEANGTNRLANGVIAWELNGIYPELDPIVRTLTHRIVRADNHALIRVEVDWASDMPPRFAVISGKSGCRLAPIGAAVGADAGTVPPEPPMKGYFPVLADGTPVFPPQRISEKSNGLLDPLAARAFDGRSYGDGSRTTAILVRRGGTVIERYAPAQRPASGPINFDTVIGGFDANTPQRTWSVAKSIAATLVGAAVYRGEADVQASAGLGLFDADPRRAITIDQLLRMASGRYSDTPGNRTDALYFGGASVGEVALDAPLIAAPGTSFRYANNDTVAAIAAIKRTFAEHPPAAFFAQVGMRGTVAETDGEGDYILSSQVWATARDLAAFGELYLNDGKLPSGTRILPEGWVKYVTTPSGPQPPTGTFGYGAGFWLLNKEEGVPPDTYAAIGNRGQYVVIVPSRKVVIVRRGEDPAGKGFDIAAFTRDVLKALPTE